MEDTLINCSKNNCKLKDFIKYFSDQKLCFDYIISIRWPKGIFCLRCKKITKYYKVGQRTSYACSRCGYQIYPLKGTMFEKSSTPLPTWFKIIFMFALSNGKITSSEIKTKLKLSYKTAWRIRSIIADNIIDIICTPIWGSLTMKLLVKNLKYKKLILRWNNKTKNGKTTKYFDSIIEDEDIFWRFLPLRNKWIRTKQIEMK
jgi:hypothetical protein